MIISNTKASRYLAVPLALAILMISLCLLNESAFGVEENIQAPHGISIDLSDYMYLTDAYNFIQKFDSNGTFIMGFGSAGSGSGKLDDPHGIAVDSSGFIYVVDTGNNRVQKFDSEGNFLIRWGSDGTEEGQFSHPHDVAVDSSGNVYVGDYWNSNVQKFDSDGNFITVWGSNGTEDGQFLNIGDQAGVEGIDVDSLGNVYVADSGNSRVQKFDSDRNFITKWGSNGTGDGQFIYPSGLAVGPNDIVYVSDEGRKNIQKFDSDGNFITKWGSPGYEDGQFGHNHYLDVDSDNNIYVTDPGFEKDPDNEDAGFVQKFNSDSKLVAKMVD